VLFELRYAGTPAVAFLLVCGSFSRRFAGLALALTLLAASGAPRAADQDSLILVADPQLDSPVFSRSVVLVTRQANGAVVGLIINHPVSVDSSRLFPRDDLLRDAGQIHFGGPVNPRTLVFLFRDKEGQTDAMHLFADVYMSNNRQLLAEQLRRPRAESGLQVYAGYAGWAPGQLQAEFMHGSWSAIEADIELLFEADRESIWETLAEENIPNWI